MNPSPIRDLKRSIHLQTRLLRRAFRRFNRLVGDRQATLRDAPIFFANSFPKSGTHLLTQVLKGFTRIGPAVDSGLPAIVTYEGDTGRHRPVRETMRDLKRLLPGDIAYGHVHAYPEAAAYLCREGVIPYFIVRDPRDVVVSHVHYVTDMEPNHIHHRYYRDELSSFNERLRASILGRPDLDVPFPDIRARFEPYFGWLDHPEIQVLRFEDFITDQKQAVERVFSHAVSRGFPANCERETAIHILISGVNPRRSPTFRSGKIGSWLAQFTPDHKRLFKEVTGDLLVRLGYERDQDW